MCYRNKMSYQPVQCYFVVVQQPGNGCTQHPLGIAIRGCAARCCHGRASLGFNWIIQVAFPVHTHIMSTWEEIRALAADLQRVQLEHTSNRCASVKTVIYCISTDCRWRTVWRLWRDWSIDNSSISCLVSTARSTLHAHILLRR
jgi:hypothetical protein